jgi:hypothetical protein
MFWVLCTYIKYVFICIVLESYMTFMFYYYFGICIIFFVCPTSTFFHPSPLAPEITKGAAPAYTGARDSGDLHICHVARRLIHIILNTVRPHSLQRVRSWRRPDMRNAAGTPVSRPPEENAASRSHIGEA